VVGVQHTVHPQLPAVMNSRPAPPAVLSASCCPTTASSVDPSCLSQQADTSACCCIATCTQSQLHVVSAPCCTNPCMITGPVQNPTSHRCNPQFFCQFVHLLRSPGRPPAPPSLPALLVFIQAEAREAPIYAKKVQSILANRPLPLLPIPHGTPTSLGHSPALQGRQALLSVHSRTG
jgi:hypothetical protein